MTRRVKLLFLRLRTDPTVPYISDRACFDMLFTGPRSVLSYWQETTGGYLDFVDSAMAPWDDATLDPAATDRVTAGMKAVAAHRARTPDWDPIPGFDGVVVLSHPGHGQVVNPAAGQPNQPATVDAGFDGGAWGFEGRKAATLPVTARTRSSPTRWVTCSVSSTATAWTTTGPTGTPTTAWT